MNAIECPDCGKSSAVGNSFCIGCGRELSSLAIEPTVEAIAISVCPNCGKENERDNLFCVGCGTQLRSTEDAASEPEPSARSCPQCGKPFAEGDAFCVFCGASLGAGDAAPFKPAVLPTGQKTEGRPKESILRAPTSMPGWLVIVICVLILLLVASLLFAAFRPSGNLGNNQTTASTTATSVSNGASDASSEVSGAATGDVASSAASSTGSTASQSAAAQGNDYVLADSSSRYYSRSELEKLSTLDLYHARNEIYARHGRGFKKDDLRAYFSSKSWYRETTSPESFNEGVLNECEKANANLMLEIEKSRNSPYLT